MPLQDWANLATIVGVVGAIVVLVMSLLQFHRDGILRKADHFGRIRTALLSGGGASEIVRLLDTDDPSLAQTTQTQRRAVLYVFEEVALLLRRELIKPELAYYMFGFSAVKCAESKNFWDGFATKQDYWPLFFDFVQKMRAQGERKKSRKWLGAVTL